LSPIPHQARPAFRPPAVSTLVHPLPSVRPPKYSSTPSSPPSARLPTGAVVPVVSFLLARPAERGGGGACLLHQHKACIGFVECVLVDRLSFGEVAAQVRQPLLFTQTQPMRRGIAGTKLRAVALPTAHFKGTGRTLAVRRARQVKLTMQRGSEAP
jgi:hypothetical protein